MFDRSGRSDIACRLICGAGLAALLCMPPLQAQTPTLAPASPRTQVSQAVVQPLPTELPGMRLNTALGKLASNPENVEALIAAGRASLDLGDVQAAIGFFQRADTLWPGSVRIRSGLAGAYALADQPVTAIELFSEAEKLGAIDGERLADRALAYDLVGDSRTAQGYYRRAIELAPNDETLRRYALSQAILGERRGMELTLSPLLERQDKAAWRTRAFALAILGDTAEAQNIAKQVLPPNLAQAMNGYLSYMQRLTMAQQAAAANLGHFPKAAEIGQEDPRYARYAQPRVLVASAAAVSPPGGAKAKGKDRDRGRDRARERVAAPAAPAPSVPTVGRENGASPTRIAQADTSSTARPVVAAAQPGPGPQGPAQSAPRTLAQPVSQPPVQGAPSAPRPAPAGPQQPASTVAATFAPPGPSAPAASRAETGEMSLEDAFAGFIPPSREIEPQPGAVDVRKIKPATTLQDDEKDNRDPKAKDPKCKDAKSKDPKCKEAKPSHPSRIWVQLATGRDKSALSFDWRRIAKEDPAAFKTLKPFVAAWGQTKRLLAGPFESQKEANAFIAKLKKAGVSGLYIWTSPAGAVVDPLAGGK